MDNASPLRKTFRFIALLAFMAGFVQPMLAQDRQAIGRVISVSGSVSATDLNGTLRELSRRSDVFAGDTIITGSDGLAQLRMVDSAQISFKADTVFTFDEYNSDGPGGAPDSALMNMLQGGFRTISGTIGDDDADDYEIRTQFASIGIRGTTHEAVIDAGSLLTGVYDGGTTISNAQGSLNTGIGANFNYSQTFPGQAPQGRLQQPIQLGQLNLNPAAANADDTDDEGDEEEEELADAGDGDNTDEENDDGNGNGGIADADDEEAAGRPLDNPQGNNQGNTIADNDNPGVNADPTTNNNRTETDINPVNNVRTGNDFENTGAGRLASAPTNPGPDTGSPGTDTSNPAPTTPGSTEQPEPVPDFIQPSDSFLALIANSGFSTDFSLSELQGITGRYSDVLAFSGLADIGSGSIGSAAVGEGSQTTAITALNMSFDLNFSAGLVGSASVSNGSLIIRLDDAPQPIVFNIFFDGNIINSQASFNIAGSSNRTQNNSSTTIDSSVSFLDAILVDNGTKQALFSDFFFQDSQGLGVEGQTLVGIAPPAAPEPSPVLGIADIESVADRIGFILSRNASPGAIFPGNTLELTPGNPVLLLANNLVSPRTVDNSPNYIFSGPGAFSQFTDGTSVDSGINENPYDFEIAVWGSSSYPISLFTDYTDDSEVSFIEIPMVVVSVDPAPLASLTGSAFYLQNLDRTLTGSSVGNVTDFFTSFDVDFATALITNGVMEFCLAGGANCTGSSSQFWSLDYSGSVIEGYVVASPVANTGHINMQQASIYGTIQGVFTGGDAQAFAGGFNLFYDPDLDDFIGETGLNIPATLVDGVFLIEREERLSASEFLSLNMGSFLIQEGYARILLGESRLTSSDGETYDIPVLFRDSRSSPPLILRDDDLSISVSRINQNLSSTNSEAFGVNWERWNGPLLAYSDNLDNAVFEDGALDLIHDVAYFSTFQTSQMTDITGHYENVLGFIGEGDAGVQISSLEMSFDINFSAAANMNNIEHGRILVDVGSSQSWLAFFEGGLARNAVEFTILASNPFDTDEKSGIYNGSLVFQNEIDTTDSRMQGVIVDDGEIPALLSSFYFREKSPYLVPPLREAVTGFALVSLSEDLRFDNSGIESGGVKQSDLENLGLVILSNPYNVSTNNVEGSIQDYIVPVFGSDTSSISDRPLFGQFTPTDGSDPYYLSLERLFINQNNSTSADIYQSNVGSYNIDWGVWNSPGSSNNGLFAYNDSQDTDINENSFKALPWLLVNDPQISTYDGTATYSHVVAKLDEDDYIGSVFTVFDVNFNTGLVDDGFINVCAGSSISCESGDGENWVAYFDGKVSGGFFNSTSVSGFIDNYYAFSGEIAGAFAAPDSDNNASPYNAFAGGFNFVKDANNSYYLSGLFLAEREARLNAEELYQMQHHIGMLVDNASVSFGVASHPSSYADGVSPKIAVNDRGNQTFEPFNIDLTGPADEVLSGTSTSVVQSSSFAIDMGYWESANMSIMHNQFNPALSSAISQDVLWANPVPVDITDYSGTYDYAETGDFLGLSSINGAIDEFSMAFSMDFTNGIVSSGTLHAGNDTANESWDATFDGGLINGSFVEFTGINGDFTDLTNSSSCLSCVTGEIRGVFTQDASFYGEGFTSGFSLNNSGNGSGLNDSVFGIGALGRVYGSVSTD